MVSSFHHGCRAASKSLKCNNNRITNKLQHIHGTQVRVNTNRFTGDTLANRWHNNDLHNGINQPELFSEISFLLGTKASFSTSLSLAVPSFNYCFQHKSMKGKNGLLSKQYGSNISIKGDLNTVH